MRLNRTPLFACVSLLALAAPANAQTSGSSDPSANNEAAENVDVIIVTARRRLEDIQDVPSVVNAVTSEDISKLNLQNFTEVQALVPGLQLRNEANGIGSGAQIRGVTYDINASAQPTVEFYQNDAPIVAGFVLQQMYDIGQIEVLRGPQGTLRGRSSPSGSVTVTTKKPDLEDFGGYVSASGNDIGGLNFNGAFGVPIIKGVLGIRVAGTYNETEANRVTTIDPDLDGRDPLSRTKGVRVSAVFEPTDWLRMEGSYQRADISRRSFDQYASYSLANPAAPASPVLITPEDRLSIQESPRLVDQTFESFNWRAEGRFAGQVLIYQGQRSKFAVDSISNDDRANFFNRVDFFQTTNTRSTQTSHEIRLQNEERVFGMFDYVVGYFNQGMVSPTRLVQETPIALPPFLGGGIVFVNRTNIATDGDIKENAVFGNLTAHIGDKFQLSGGLRYIHFKEPARFLTIGTANLSTGPATIDKKLIYTASAQYKFTPDVMVYASTGTSRRPGPTIIGNFSPVQSDLQRSFTFLKPEDSTSYELGLKSSFMDGRGRFNITAYYQKFKNYPYKLTTGVYYQTFNFIPPATLAPAVALGASFAASVPVEVKGIEAEIGFKPSPNFDLSAVLSYSDGKIKNGLIPCDDLNGDGNPDTLTSVPTLAQVQAAYGANYIGSCNVSQRSSNQAPFSATLLASYAIPISNKVDAFTRGLLTYQGKSIGDPANAFDSVGNYGLLNLFAGIRDPDGAWEINFFAKNILDTTKALTFDPVATTGFQQLQPPTFQTTAGVNRSSTYSIITTTPPREFGISVRFAFGSR